MGSVSDIATITGSSFVSSVGPLLINRQFAALIPPSTFLLVLPHLPMHTFPPIHMRTFSSGLSVLHTPPFHRAAFSARLVRLLALGTLRTLLPHA